MVWTQPDFGKLTQAAYTPSKLGCVDVFLAPRMTVYTANIGKNGSWLYLGRILAGTFKNDFTPKFYDVMTGVPSTMKETYIVGINGKIDFTLQEPTGLVYSLATQHGIRIQGYRTTSPVATTMGTPGSNPTKTLVLTASTGMNVGDEIEVVINGVSEFTICQAVNSGTSIDVYPLLSTAPVATNPVKVVDSWEFAMGTAVIKHNAVMSVFTATDGSQIITWIGDCRSEGVKDDFADGTKEMNVPITLDAFGFTDVGGNWAANGPIVAKKYILKPQAAMAYTAPAA